MMEAEEDSDGQKDGIYAPKLGSKECTFTKLGKRLFQMAKDGDAEEVKRLIAKGAPFHTNLLGTSPLHWAAHYNHVEVTEVLLKAGISVNAKNKVDRTPIHEAAHMGNPAVLKLLLAYGGDVDCLDMLQMTPLHWAGESGNTACVQLLLDYGCDINRVSKFQKTALEVAQGNNYYAAVQMIKSAMKEDPTIRKIKVKHFKEGNRIIAVKDIKTESTGENSGNLSPNNKRKRYSTVIVSKPNPVTGVQTTLELINDNISDEEKETKIRKIKVVDVPSINHSSNMTKNFTNPLRMSEKLISSPVVTSDKKSLAKKIEKVQIKKDEPKIVVVPKHPFSTVTSDSKPMKRILTKTNLMEYALQQIKSTNPSKAMVKTTGENKTPKLVTIPKLVSIKSEATSPFALKSDSVQIIKTDEKKQRKITEESPKKLIIDPNQIKNDFDRLNKKKILKVFPAQMNMIKNNVTKSEGDCQIGNVLITNSPDKIKKLIKIKDTGGKIDSLTPIVSNPGVSKLVKIDANQLINMKKKKLLFFRKPVVKNNASTNAIREMIEEKLKTAQKEADDLREKLKEKEEEIIGFKSFIESMAKA